jgi:hypothetical protein
MHTKVVNTVTVAHTKAVQRRMIGGISEIIGINMEEAVLYEFKLRFVNRVKKNMTMFRKDDIVVWEFRSRQQQCART